ncbi:MAG: ABC transporter ATP-binding protein [Desulfovibrio sp.]|nr:ABC transporter ATP-binding protein [Desulfovibrio sp.]
MILVQDVHKRYKTKRGVGKWVLRGINLVIPTGRSVGLIGKNGAGKSTLLRIIGGVDYPTKGKVVRNCRVSWPMNGGGLEATLTGRQNAKFTCRIHGHQADLEERIQRIEDFAELGTYFDEPVQTYSSGMKARLQFALSMAFDFDVYISDEATAAGDATFVKKAQKAFDDAVNRASLIMVAHNEAKLKSFCQSGIFLYNGKAIWYEKIDDALAAYRESIQ